MPLERAHGRRDRDVDLLLNHPRISSGTGDPVSTDQPAGSVYLDTASGAVWQFDGESWSKIGTLTPPA